MKKFTLFFALILFAYQAISQATSSSVLTGKIVDEYGEPLAGVSIALKDKTFAGFSDKNGCFKINVASQDIVLFYYAGAVPCEYTLAEIELELKNTIVMDFIELPECVITATRQVWSPGLTTSDYWETQKYLAITISLKARPWEYAPNPTRDAVIVQTQEAAGSILVFSANGSEVTRIGVTTVATRVELAEYAAGIYFLYFENAGWAQSIGKVVLAKD